ncbi:MAG: hypothetical protein IJ860_09050 [Eubacterium sp.]|nr:hypothetical protein [Eubacterium sp.]
MSVKVDYNEKMIKQQYEPMTPQEQYRIKMEALQEIKDSGIDYCSCPEACPHHGNCWECVLIHRGHRDHLPYCFWDMINEKLYGLERLTEGSMKKWTPHEAGEVPRQYHCPMDGCPEGCAVEGSHEIYCPESGDQTE